LLRSQNLPLLLVTIRHVEELHDVCRVFALAAQRASNLVAYGCLVIGERKQAHAAAGNGQTIAQPLGLCLFAALVEPFEGDQQPVASFQGRAHRPASAGAGSPTTRRRPRALPPAAYGGASPLPPPTP